MSPIKKSNAQRFMDLMTSMRLTIIILIVLACASILIIIFQDYHPTNFYGWEEYYRTNTHPVKYALYQFFELFSPYRSWWFLSLLTILCTSLLLCSLQRFKIIFKFLTANNDFRDAENVSHLENFHQIKMPTDQAVPLVSRMLKRKFFKVFLREENGTTFLFARKHSISRLGPFLSHIGLLALFVGGLISGLMGRSALLWGGPGEYIEAPFADHKLLVEDFTIEYNDEGQIKDYLSFVKVFDRRDNHVLDKRIEVNGPLRFDGVSYYQSSYRTHSRKARNVTVAVSDSSGTRMGAITVEFGSVQRVPGTDYQIEFAGFTADFQITSEGITSKSDKLNNPAFLLQFLRGDQVLGHQWLFARFPDVHAEERTPIAASFVSFEPYYYTGLQASKNPGSPFIWAGFIIMTLGLILVFYFNHRLIWATFVTRPGTQDELYIAGSCHKFKEQYKRDMKELAAKIKSEKSGENRARPASAISH